MWFPPMPSTKDLSLFMNWQCIHILSNRKYHEYVTEEAAQPDKVPPLRTVRTAACYLGIVVVLRWPLSCTVLTGGRFPVRHT